eukprot:6470293-Amphidinium_carterae.1
MTKLHCLGTFVLITEDEAVGYRKIRTRYVYDAMKQNTRLPFGILLQCRQRNHRQHSTLFMNHPERTTSARSLRRPAKMPSKHQNSEGQGPRCSKLHIKLKHK